MAESRNSFLSKLAAGVTSDGDISSDAIAPSVTQSLGTSVYDSASLLPIVGNTAGDTAFVKSTSRLYIHSGLGWYNVAVINNTPTVQSILDSDGGNTPFVLSSEGAVTTITITAQDSDGDPLTYNYSADSDFSGLATLSQDANVFTITPFSEDSATTTSGTITFSVTDGMNTATPAVQTFTLNFSVSLADPTNITLNTDDQPSGWGGGSVPNIGHIWAWDSVNSKLLNHDWGSNVISIWNDTASGPTYNSYFSMAPLTQTSIESMFINSGFLIVGTWVNVVGVFNLNNSYSYVGAYALTKYKLGTYDGCNYVLCGDSSANIRKYPFNTSTGAITTTASQTLNIGSQGQVTAIFYLNAMSAAEGKDMWLCTYGNSTTGVGIRIISCSNSGTSALSSESSIVTGSVHPGSTAVAYDHGTGTVLVSGDGRTDFGSWYHNADGSSLSYKGHYTLGQAAGGLGISTSPGYAYAYCGTATVFKVIQINADHSLTLADEVTYSQSFTYIGITSTATGQSYDRPGGFGMLTDNQYFVFNRLDNGTTLQWIT